MSVKNRPDQGEELIDGLKPDLKSRHVSMLAIGGAIGVGLFLGSGAGIELTGPSIILAYAVVGMFIFVVMRAFGELLSYRSISGSIAEFAREFLGPKMGFIAGWGYWLTWSLIGMTELTAAGVFIQFWFPDVPGWVTAAVALVALVILNLLQVGYFGEAEFWFASIKVIAIGGLILLGIAVLIFRFGPTGDTASLANLFTVTHSDGTSGFFPYGFTAFLLAIPIAVFSFQGTELVGMTASEARNRKVVIPKAINAVPFRISFFYVGALAVLMSVVPWDQFSSAESPFVHALSVLGTPGAAGIMNFVVLTSALSACSSGPVYSNARLLMRMAKNGIAPKTFDKTGITHVPSRAVLASGGVMLIGVAINFVIPEQAFAVLVAVCSFAALWNWGIILACYISYKKKVFRGERPASDFRLKGGVALSWITICFLALIVVLMAFDAGNRLALYTVPFWALALIIGYQSSKRWNPGHQKYLKMSETVPSNDTGREPQPDPKYIARKNAKGL
ncbi:amino acid permease [Brevibacterium zhoupengii]|uniref:amino acid permease n=1 Tax=Brevibacterium zhoupengii TaxID=2898795 RepID=UPI001E3B1F91|nr:amino acid permease [Brevibacterium zhoupengii]